MDKRQVRNAMSLSSHEVAALYMSSLPTTQTTQETVEHPVSKSSGARIARVYQDAIISAIYLRRKMLDEALGELVSQAKLLVDTAWWLVNTLRSGHKVLVMGNGGSAAQAQHFAAELVGRFKRERAAYGVLALTTDTSIITAIANDYGFQQVFARQVQAFGQPGDMLIAFSISGESESVLQAAQIGRERLMSVIAITGERSSRLESLADVTIKVPMVDTVLVQELHMMLSHMLCDITEEQLSAFEGEVSDESCSSFS